MTEGVALHCRANDVLAELDAAALADDELEAVVVALHREIQRAVAVEARLAAVYDARKAFRSDGSKTAAARLSHQTGASRKEMRGRVQLGRRLRLMPRVDAALADGEITVEHARILGKLAASEREPVAAAFAGAEEQLVGFARDLSFEDFVRAIRYWEQHADRDGTEDKAARQQASRRVHMSQTLDGMFVMDGLFDPVNGTVVATALRRIEKELFEQDWADAREIYGDDTRIEDLARTPAQRRADATVLMAERAMAMPKDARVPLPLVTVHVGYETFAGPLCELADGTVVTPGQILPLLTRAEIERAVFAGPNRIIELGQRTRCFTGGLRRCVEIIHRKCFAPGCDLPAEECQIDHIVEYEDGGLTTQNNGQPACGSDNRNKHNTKRRGRAPAIGSARKHGGCRARSPGPATGPPLT